MSSITSIDKKVLKGQLYKIKETQTVTITEKDENVNQRVRIHFKISDKKILLYMVKNGKASMPLIPI